MSQSDIVIRGAREHNLRGIDLRLPRNKLVVMTGVSGSGKSSLAFDTLYAEGQRRYVESLSSFARQFLGQLPKPEVESISGLAPSISIQQKTRGRNPRSTVGTITEVYDYLRLLYARIGQGNCCQCGRVITAQTHEQIVESVLQQAAGTRYQILAPLVQQQKGEYRDLFDDLLKQGYLRARVNGTFTQLNENLQLDRQMRHTIEVVVDRLLAGKTSRSRLSEAVETALRLSGGTLIVSQEAPQSSAIAQAEAEAEIRDDQLFNRRTSAGTASASSLQPHQDRLYSSSYACTHCDTSFEPPTPQLFSFNSPQGMCDDCNGLGTRHDFVVERLIADDRKSIAQGAIHLLPRLRKIGRWRRHIFQGVARVIEQDLGWAEDTFLKTAWRDLPDAALQQFLYGMGNRNITFQWRHSGGLWKHGGTWSGFVSDLLENYRKTRNSMRRRQLEKYMDTAVCAGCEGSRLNAQARNVTLTSSSEAYAARAKPTRMTLPQVCGLSIQEAAEFFEQLELTETARMIAAEVLKEIRGRLGFLLRCGLDYLTLERTAPSLSGGESQRIRLAGQIGSGLVGIVYILDEPSIGLHPRDNRMLLDSLCDLRDRGNTVIVVEHDEETIQTADHIIDFGPGPGIRGGRIVAEGSIGEIKRRKNSITGQFLAGKRSIGTPSQRRQRGGKSVRIVGARHNNLKEIDVAFPLETFICVTGVSGSGKSSLVNDILWQVLNRDVNNGKGRPQSYKQVDGLQHLDKAIDIDQSPIGRTPRSNPATYVNLFDLIRDLYAKLPESRMRGYKPGRFSFNVSGGRCEACNGYGSNRLEMDFLADIWVTCPICEGRRFNHETLEVQFKGVNIAEVLDMDVQRALEHFSNVPKIIALLQTLHDVGLDYLKLGQPSPTLSGGEAQRIKLARELGKRSTGRTIYLLDEPTTGLHFADVQMLLEVLHGFVDAGNTVLVVEHNLDVIKTADWVIDLGPEGGDGGGTVVAQGPPEVIAASSESYTGHALAPVLAVKGRGQGSKGRGQKSKGRGQKLKGREQKLKGREQIAADAGRVKGESRNIVINGAYQHNLQNLDLSIPRGRMNVFCGPSGSGKSSLAMDTLYAEGQRRYVESLSAYARQFLGQMPKPRVEHIHGLSPAIAIEQKSTGHTPRSTVGTVTEIYDYLRILYARLGTLYCPNCQIPVVTQSVDEVIDKLLNLPRGTRLSLLAPQEVPTGQSYEQLWKRVREQGFLRVRIDETSYRLDDVPAIDRRRKHQVEIVVDRVTLTPTARSRIANSVEMALDLGRGVMLAAHYEDRASEPNGRVDRYSLLYSCEQCGRSFEELTPHNFSFNSSLGWCPACQGLGTQQGTNLAELVNDPSRTLADGAVTAWPDATVNQTFHQMLLAMSKHMRLPLDVPFNRLDPLHRRMVLYGTGERWIPLSPEKLVRFQYKGLYPAIEEAARVSYVYRRRLLDLVGEVACSACHGSRLRDDSANVRFRDKTLQQVCELPLSESLWLLKQVKPSSGERKIAGDLLREATGRLSFLVDVGLDYLALSRPLPTLSGGESQRIRLAGQIGRALTGVLYVLDEPTIGLHPRDNTRLVSALHKLRDLGNTLILVEHDRDVLNAADRLFDFGPGAGRYGGQIVGQGTPKQLARTKRSLTGQFLSNRKSIPIPVNRRLASPTPGNGWIELIGAKQHNLRDVDLRIPLGTLTCITGVSGSGKSSLIDQTLAKAISRQLHHTSDMPGPYDELLGLEHINKVINVDQQPLGNTPKSNPGTYTGVFDAIRELFARLPGAKIRGYRPGRFSFNRAGGRCETCEGNGQRCIEMHFLPDVWVQCDDCRGQRYNRETLGVKYRGKSISDVLDMPISQADELFANIPKIRRHLATLRAIGLEYLTLGQPAPTLSGGEAQRVKLAAELSRPNTGKTLYLLDEPTTGLHLDDINNLLKVLNSLVDRGNTVVVIEHNLDVIKTADWVVDLGPDAGDQGGWIVAEGTPEQIVAQASQYRSRKTRQNVDAGNKPTKQARAAGKTAQPRASFRSYTGEMLRGVLKTGEKFQRESFELDSISEKRDGDLDFAQIGRETKMPWETDGRRWHTVDRIGHNGQPCRWEGEALARVVDQIEAHAAFPSTNWKNRSIVEITGQSKKNGWFFHGLTGDEWMLTLKFRVRRNSFRQEQLSGQLALKAWDDIDELPVYGRLERVRVKNLKGPWQEISITVHWRQDIENAEFHRFLDEACCSFVQKAEETKLRPADLMPWKVLGRKWHLSRKGFPSSKRVNWKQDALDALLEQIQAAVEHAAVDWANKQVVHFRRQGEKKAWASIYTKRRDGIDLMLFAEAGHVVLGRINNFGAQREINAMANGQDKIRIRFTDKTQVGAKEWKQFLSEFADDR